MWVAAHPDDDVLVAPILASLCLDRDVECTLMVLTRGEKGNCHLEGECPSDVGMVRSAEMGSASQYFGANLVLLKYSDGGGKPDGSAPAWDLEAGGHQRLVTSLSFLLQSFQADVILTFDPRHGTTCHLDHMATGKLVREASVEAGILAKLYYLESRLHVTTPIRFQFSPAFAGPGLKSFNANVPLISNGQPSWSALVNTMRIHRSQFNELWVAAALDVPASERVIFFAGATEAERSPNLNCR